MPIQLTVPIFFQQQNIFSKENENLFTNQISLQSPEKTFKYKNMFRLTWKIAGSYMQRLAAYYTLLQSERCGNVGSLHMQLHFSFHNNMSARHKAEYNDFSFISKSSLIAKHAKYKN